MGDRTAQTTISTHIFRDMGRKLVANVYILCDFVTNVYVSWLTV